MLHHVSHLPWCQVEVADLTLGFGVHVPGLPRRAMRLEFGDDLVGCRCEPCGGDLGARRLVVIEGGVDHDS